MILKNRLGPENSEIGSGGYLKIKQKGTDLENRARITKNVLREKLKKDFLIQRGFYNYH